jgi:SET domain-containing protein
VPELTAFVREVVLPGGPDVVPRLDPAACRFNLRHRRSKIDRWGLFAAEPIPPRRRVIDYTGEKIGRKEMWRRSLRPRIFFFRVSERRSIDGAVGGSGAEFINHGCEPNLVARVRKGRVTFVSLRPIARGEELLLDYQLAGNIPLLACRCGARSCRGFMNRPLKSPGAKLRRHRRNSS